MRVYLCAGRVCPAARPLDPPIFANFFVHLFSGGIIYANKPLGFKELLSKGGNKITGGAYTYQTYKHQAFQLLFLKEI